MTCTCGDACCENPTGLLIAQADDGDDPLVVYGPISVEVRSDDNKLIRMSAIEAALPQLLKRGALTIMHKDQLVGEIHEALEVDQANAPNTAAARLLEEYGGKLKTEVREATEADAEAFPRLEPFVGEPVAFAVATVHNDNQTARQVREEIQQGNLDSFSISGMATESKASQHCGVDGCQTVEEITEMDLSAVTLAASTDAKDGPFSAPARNAGAQLIVVQQCHDHTTQPYTYSTHPNAQTDTTSNKGTGTMTEQANDNPPNPDTVEEHGGGQDDAQNELLLQLKRDIDAMKQEVAQLKGTTEEATDDAPMNDEEDEEDEEEDVEINVADDDEDEDEDEVEESSPKGLNSTLSKINKTLTALTQAQDKGTGSEVAQASTPTPASPSRKRRNGPSDRVKAVEQAAWTGDYGKLTTALMNLREDT